MDRIAVVITGIKRLDRRLRTLEPRVQKKVLRRAMRSGMKVVAEAVKAEAPVDTGTMKGAVKVRAVKRRRRGSIELEVRILADESTRRTSAKTGKTVFYPAVVQYGTDKRPANAFMTRAYVRSGERARQTTLRELRDGVEREASRG